MTRIWKSFRLLLHKRAYRKGAKAGSRSFQISIPAPAVFFIESLRKRQICSIFIG
jgi:hypothetical protein